MIILKLHILTQDCLFLFQLYDRISSKVVSPMRSPPSDAVERCRDAINYLRDLELNPIDPDVDYADIDDLRALLLKPHFKVCFQRRPFVILRIVLSSKPGTKFCFPASISICLFMKQTAGGCIVEMQRNVVWKLPTDVSVSCVSIKVVLRRDELSG